MVILTQIIKTIVYHTNDGSPPEAVVVLDYILAETLNGLTTYAGHNADIYSRIASLNVPRSCSQLPAPGTKTTRGDSRCR